MSGGQSEGGGLGTSLPPGGSRMKRDKRDRLKSRRLRQASRAWIIIADADLRSAPSKRRHHHHDHGENHGDQNPLLDGFPSIPIHRQSPAGFLPDGQVFG